MQKRFNHHSGVTRRGNLWRGEAAVSLDACCPAKRQGPNSASGQVADILTKASTPLVLGLCGQLPSFALRSGSSARSPSSAFYLGKSSQGNCSSEM